jgi:hypothetical protein
LSRYERSGDDAHARQAYQSYDLVLAGAERHALPGIYVFRAAAALVRLQVRLYAWQNAAIAYRTASDALEKLYAPLFSRANKESWLAETQGLPANAAYAFSRLDRPEEAVAVLEAGRARLLAEVLEQNRRDLERLTDLGHGELWERYRRVVGRIQQLQQPGEQTAALQTSEQRPAWQDFAALHQRMEAARAELDGIIAEIRQVTANGQQPYADFQRPPASARSRSQPRRRRWSTCWPPRPVGWR